MLAPVLTLLSKFSISAKIFLISKNIFVLSILGVFFPFKTAPSFCFIVTIYFPKSLDVVIAVSFFQVFFSLYILFPPNSVFLFLFCLLY